MGADILETLSQLRALHPGWLTVSFPQEPESSREPSTTTSAVGMTAPHSSVKQPGLSIYPDAGS